MEETIRLFNAFRSTRREGEPLTFNNAWYRGCQTLLYLKAGCWIIDLGMGFYATECDSTTTVGYGQQGLLKCEAALFGFAMKIDRYKQEIKELADAAS